MMGRGLGTRPRIKPRRRLRQARQVDGLGLRKSRRGFAEVGLGRRFDPDEPVPVRNSIQIRLQNLRLIPAPFELQRLGFLPRFGPNRSPFAR